MKTFLNIISIVLLTISIFITTIVFTLTNKYYIKHIYNKYDYYNISIKYLDDNVGEYELDNKLLKKDINDYINNYFKDKTYSNKMNNNLDDIYNNAIKQIGPYNDMHMFRDIICLIDLVLIIGTGILLVKTKKKHNIRLIILITGIIGIILSFVVYYNINYNYMINNILLDYYRLYLSINILMILYPIYKKVYTKIVNKRKKSI